MREKDKKEVHKVFKSGGGKDIADAMLKYFRKHMTENPFLVVKKAKTEIFDGTLNLDTVKSLTKQ